MLIAASFYIFTMNNHFGVIPNLIYFYLETLQWVYLFLFLFTPMVNTFSQNNILKLPYLT